MEDRPDCISILDVQHAVARAFCLSIGEMLSRQRRHRLSSARQIAMYLSRELAGGGWRGPRRQAASFPRIGMAFARDHTSVIHACDVVARRRLADAEFARLLDRIAHELTAAAHKPAGCLNGHVHMPNRKRPIDATECHSIGALATQHLVCRLRLERRSFTAEQPRVIGNRAETRAAPRAAGSRRRRTAEEAQLRQVQAQFKQDDHFALPGAAEDRAGPQANRKPGER